MKRNNKGITLIALVITIIILLILAAISIATLTGENGLLGQAKSAKEKTEMAEVIERAQTDILAVQAENYGKITKEQLKTVLDKYFTDAPDPLPDDLTTVKLTAKEEYGGHKNIALSDIYQGNLSTGEEEENLDMQVNIGVVSTKGVGLKVYYSIYSAEGVCVIDNSSADTTIQMLLPAGNYRLKINEVPSGYIKPGDTIFEIKPNVDSNFNILIEEKSLEGPVTPPVP